MCIGVSPYDEEITLYYNIDKNIMIDGDGFEVINIFSIIAPNILYLFKKKKEDMVVYGINGQLVEILYPIEDEE